MWKDEPAAQVLGKKKKKRQNQQKMQLFSGSPRKKNNPTAVKSSSIQSGRSGAPSSCSASVAPRTSLPRAVRWAGWAFPNPAVSGQRVSPQGFLAGKLQAGAFKQHLRVGNGACFLLWVASGDFLASSNAVVKMRRITVSRV